MLIILIYDIITKNLYHSVKIIWHHSAILHLKCSAGPGDNQTNIGTECPAAEEVSNDTKYVSLW